MWGALLVAGSVSATIALGFVLTKLAIALMLGLVPSAGQNGVGALEPGAPKTG